MAVFELVGLLVEENVGVLSLLGGTAQVRANEFDAVVVIPKPLAIVFDKGVVMAFHG